MAGSCADNLASLNMSDRRGQNQQKMTLDSVRYCHLHTSPHQMWKKTLTSEQIVSTKGETSTDIHTQYGSTEACNGSTVSGFTAQPRQAAREHADDQRQPYALQHWLGQSATQDPWTAFRRFEGVPADSAPNPEHNQASGGANN